MLRLWVIKTDLTRAMRIIIETEYEDVMAQTEVWAKYGRARVEFDSSPHRVVSDAEIASAIKALLHEFTTITQWVAIYRILVDYHGFPQPFSLFCRRIYTMMPGFKSRFACDYQAIQKGIGNGILKKPYDEWLTYQPKKNDKVFPRQKRTAERFLQLLEKV